MFRPGTGFREFYFDATGDTNATSTANAGYGGWGTLYKLVQPDPRADERVLLGYFVRNRTEHHCALDRESDQRTVSAAACEGTVHPDGSGRVMASSRPSAPIACTS